jgi:predicted permease
MKPWRPWRWIVRRDAAEEVNEELQFHLEERIRDYVDRGMSPEAARDAAVRRFGDPARIRDACAPLLAAERHADARRTLWRVSWLDVKLGLRMFINYPGLSLVSVTGMAVAIAIGAGYFTVLGTWLDATLPLPDGERVVSIRDRSTSGSSVSDPSGAEWLEWREQLRSIRDLAAFRDESSNVTLDGSTDVIDVAAMSAAGFRVARVAPVLGRALVDEDERPGAPPVLVIGYDEWQSRFGGDAHILDRTVRLDDTIYAIVGVMPQGFTFPANYAYWVPLRVTSAIAEDHLRAFGRLADGYSLVDARAETAAMGDRMAALFPQTYSKRRPRVLPYTHAFIGIQGPEMEIFIRGVQFGVGLLLLIVAVNVAILVYARTATRMGEIAVRTALGASRARVVSQLFIEALVPSAAAAAVGLALLHVALKMIRAAVAQDSDGAGQLPFLVDFRLTPGVVIYVTLLAILAAVIAGVLPALKATGARVQQDLQQFSARGAGVRLGRTWTALIVLQVAVAVAVLPAALYYGSQVLRLATRRPAPAAHGLVRATLDISREGRVQGVEKRLPAFAAALIERLEADPDIAAVTFADGFPGEENYSTIEIAGDAGAAAVDREDAPLPVRTSAVAPNFFDVFQVPVVAGRGFNASDARPGASAVVVDETFVQQFGGANVIGKRVRYASTDDRTAPGPWFEIVGVVPAFAFDFTSPQGPSFQPPLPRLFHATPPGVGDARTMVMRLSGDPAPSFTSRVRQTAVTVDPGLRLDKVEGVVDVWDESQHLMRLIALAIVAVMGSVLLLSSAGIYAMMSFTVARRRREIGIRAALGADARRILAGIFGRAAAQLAAGVALGLTVAAGLDWLSDGALTGGHTLTLLPGVVVVTSIVGLLAAVAPARRGLAVQPVEALRNE